MATLNEHHKLKTEVVHKTVATRTFEWHEIKDLLIARLIDEMGIAKIATAIDHSARLRDSHAKLRNGATVEIKVRNVEEGSPSHGTDKYEITLTYTHDHVPVADKGEATTPGMGF